MSKEMVAYSNNNFLKQASESMLSQANQSKQMILSLLGYVKNIIGIWIYMWNSRYLQGYMR